MTWIGILGRIHAGEILLRPRQYCNLSEVVVRPQDNLETLKKKVRLATILGTFQSTLTNFKYISKQWKNNCEEERLLGVSLTGVMDHEIMSGQGDKATLKKWLNELREMAVATNKEFAAKLGIPQSAAITCVKPSGTVSQLVDAASGGHPRHSQYYIRTVRGDKKDPLAQFLKDQGVPCEDDVMAPSTTEVFSFPIKAPENCVTRNELSAIEQLETWLIYKEEWCEHNPSITVTVREDEWMAVGAWCYDHFDQIGGISFLPHSDHVYRQAPYQEIDKEAYEKFVEKMPKTLDWNQLSDYELEDYTVSSQELACSGPQGCEVL